MGMLLRRHNRKPDYAPAVNGKPVAKEPKKKSLTNNATTNAPKATVNNNYYQK